jgi:hypothetical protein
MSKSFVSIIFRLNPEKVTSDVFKTLKKPSQNNVDELAEINKSGRLTIEDFAPEIDKLQEKSWLEILEISTHSSVPAK